MAFMGIFAVSILLMVIAIIFICVLLFVFIPCLIIFIINLVKGIIHKWPKRNIVGVVITGIILGTLITGYLVLMLISAIIEAGQGASEVTSSEAAIAMQYLLS